MAFYSSFSESQGNVLKRGDHVIFDYEGFHIEYIVKENSLSAVELSHERENDIFRLLGLDPFDFCEQHYTSLPNKWKVCVKHYANYWPPYCEEDLKSVTKVVLELFRLIEEVPKQLAETSEILFID